MVKVPMGGRKKKLKPSTETMEVKMASVSPQVVAAQQDEQQHEERDGGGVDGQNPEADGDERGHGDGADRVPFRMKLGLALRGH